MATGTSVPCCSSLPVVRLECPHNMAAASRRASGPGERGEEAAEPPLTQSLKTHIITSTSFCSLEATHQVQPTFIGRGISFYLLKEYQRIYGQFLEPTTQGFCFLYLLSHHLSSFCWLFILVPSLISAVSFHVIYLSCGSVPLLALGCPVIVLGRVLGVGLFCYVYPESLVLSHSSSPDFPSVTVFSRVLRTLLHTLLKL